MKEKEIRKDLAAAYRLIFIFGWNEVIYNHISARLPGSQNLFLLNPFGLGYEEITASSLIIVDDHVTTSQKLKDLCSCRILEDLERGTPQEYEQNPPNTFESLIVDMFWYFKKKKKLG